MTHGDACRCERCLTRRRRQAKLRRMGRAGLVDAGPLAAKFRSLQGNGWTLRDIEAASGLSISQVVLIVNGTRPRVRYDTAQRALGADYSRRKPGGTADGTGTVRRLQALHAIGWAWADVAAAVGMRRASICDLALGKVRPTVATVDAIAGLYDRVSGTPGPCARARARAARRGWLPPAALDEDRIDEPGYEGERDWLRGEQPGVQHEDVRWLIDQGESIPTAAVRLGVSEAYCKQLLRRTG